MKWMILFLDLEIQKENNLLFVFNLINIIKFYYLIFNNKK